MRRKWTDLDELLTALTKRAISGRQVTLSPETTVLLIRAVHDLSPDSNQKPRGTVDWYAEGSTIYRLSAEGEDEEVVAWARNALVARAALDELTRRYPDAQFLQRRRSWVEWKSWS